MKKKIFVYIFSYLVIINISLFLLLYFGPYDNIRNTIVNSALTTQKFKWIANVFLDEEEIQSVMSNSMLNFSGSNLKELKKISTDNNDNNIDMYNIEGKNYNGKVLIIKNPKRIKVGYTSKLGIEGETTTEIAERYNALAAVNGGGFKGGKNGQAWVGSGGEPIGFIISDGKLVYSDIEKHKKTYVVGITKNGVLVVGSSSIDELFEKEVVEAVTFGPPLVVNGKGTIETGDGGWGIAPRTAIGQTSKGDIVLVVIDGRRPGCLGATLKEVQDVLLAFNAYNASNLDGGYSSTMYFEGEVINNPPFILGERLIPTILYVEKGE